LDIEISPAWKRITVSAFSGVILVIGAPDTGKSTFARYLYRRLYEHHERVAFVDGDIGQATLGPPTTMTLALGHPGDDTFPLSGPRFRVFVGDVSPRGHMLPTLVGAHKLVRRALTEGATAVVFDTTGLVDPAFGGGALKLAKVDLLQPAAVVGIQRRSELEHLLVPLRRSHRTRVIDLAALQGTRRRETSVRQEHRANQFRHYFEDARPLDIAWRNLAVFPAPIFRPHQLVALEDREGFTLGLGIIATSDSTHHTITLHTPISSLSAADAIRLGSLALDPRTFRESPMR
jgi:polynucleotide 5'-hydroxyl-kinase GRC3/NOL9